MSRPARRRRSASTTRCAASCAFERATAILRDNRAVLDRTARTLLAKETLEEHDIVELTADLKRSK